jgi:hypothetical protein
MRFALRIEQHVPGFDVAMQNTALVRVMNGAREGRDEAGGLLGRVISEQ